MTSHSANLSLVIIITLNSSNIVLRYNDERNGNYLTKKKNYIFGGQITWTPTLEYGRRTDRMTLCIRRTIIFAYAV